MAVAATRGNNYVFVYISTGLTAKLNLECCNWKKANCWWYNRRTGKATSAGKVAISGTKEFTPPTRGLGNDWVLVLDNAEAGLKEPGK